MTTGQGDSRQDGRGKGSPEAADRAPAAWPGGPSKAQRAVEQYGSFFYDEARHRLSLPVVAASLVAQGRLRPALSLLDRFFRIGGEGVNERLLEASVLHRLAGPDAALSSFRRAFALDPNDPGSQRQLLDALEGHGKVEEARDIARRVIGRSGDPAVLVRALAVARPGWTVFGTLETGGGECRGWCVWKGGHATRTLDIMADGRTARLTVASSPHPGWNALRMRHAAFRFAWPGTAAVVDVRDAETGESMRGSPVMNDETVEPGRVAQRSGLAVTVIVPVYEDAAATRRTFDALLADRSTLARRILVVEDASPNPMIRALVDRLAASGAIELIRNPHNVGFVRAVNRALRRVGDEDVVLLNADTHVPPGWLERMSAVAAGDRVGTVTPLSNNGELVSVPAPFAPWPMPAPETVLAVDRHVASRNLPPVVLPNGVGFCLYIRNAALRAVGLLDAVRYERGYLEEVDFCLRVAEAGFRNICAMNVFVGHQGEASFGDSKRALVTLNAVELRRRWPRIEDETGVFVRADPLRPLRSAVAWACLETLPARRLVLAPTALLGDYAGGIDQAGGKADVVLTGSPLDAGTWRLRFPDLRVPVVPDGQAATPAEALADIARRLSARSAVAVVTAESDDAWIDVATAAGLPVTLLPLDASCLCGGEAGAQAGCPLLVDSACRRCGIVLPGRPHARGESGPPQRPGRLAELARHASRIVVPSRSLAHDLAAPPPWAADGRPELVCRPAPAPAAAAPRTAGLEPFDDDVIGIVPADEAADTALFIEALARAFLRAGSGKRLVVLGSTIRDLGLMRLGNVFVTGRVDGELPSAVLERHPCSGLLLSSRREVHASPALDFVRDAGMPFAAFPVGGALDLLNEVDDGIPLDIAWSTDQIAFVAERFLSRSGIAALRRPAGDTA